MGRGYFRGFTAAEKTELWDRWQRGESLKAIGRAFGKPSSSIYFQLAPQADLRRRSRLRPVVPVDVIAPLQRNRFKLTSAASGTCRVSAKEWQRSYLPQAGESEIDLVRNPSAGRRRETLTIHTCAPETCDVRAGKRIGDGSV